MKTRTLTYLLLLFHSVTFGQTTKQSFEGKISYKVIVVPLTENAKYNEYQRHKYGSEVEYLYDGQGNFKITYTNSGLNGYDFTLYNKVQNKVYTKFKNIDTVFSYSPSENALTLIEEKEGKQITIKNRLCSTFSILGVEPKSGQKMQFIYSYPKNAECLSPENYVGYKEMFLDKIIAKAQAPFYKLEMNTQKYTLIYELNEIQSRSVNKEEFLLPENIPVN